MEMVDLPCGRSFMIDAADLCQLKGRHWHADVRAHTVYVRGRRPGQRSAGKYLHNLLVGGQADHRDGDGLNNTRANLRPCTQAQNGLNRSAKRGKRFKGVYADRGKFYAEIYKDKKRYCARGYGTAEEAARAYDQMALRLHGKWARLNFPGRQGEMFDEVKP